MSGNYLVWLEWPEKCFRVNAQALRFLRSLLPNGARVIHARSESAFLRQLPKATHAIVWNFNPEWFAKAGRLKLLATPAAGREFVPEKGPEGVRIHFGHFHGRFIAESVAAFMLAWAHGFFRQLKGEAGNDPWPRTWLSDKCSSVRSTKAVIAGFGNVGKTVGKYLEMLGVEVVGIARHGVFKGAKKPVRIDGRRLSTALKAADWMILALPSTTGTDDFLNAGLIRKLSRKCVVINVGRGNAVDELALYEALHGGRLAGAYLDVRRHEPSATVLESPGFVPGLADLPSCITMPHSSAFDGDYINACFRELKDDGCI